jgi:hypothetical protein
MTNDPTEPADVADRIRAQRLIDHQRPQERSEPDNE